MKFFIFYFLLFFCFDSSQFTLEKSRTERLKYFREKTKLCEHHSFQLQQKCQRSLANVLWKQRAKGKIHLTLVLSKLILYIFSSSFFSLFISVKLTTSCKKVLQKPSAALLIYQFEYKISPRKLKILYKQLPHPWDTTHYSLPYLQITGNKFPLLNEGRKGWMKKIVYCFNKYCLCGVLSAKCLKSLRMQNFLRL